MQKKHPLKFVDPVAKAIAEGQIGPFILQEKLGEGAMGKVYRAIHDENGKEVAIKFLPRDTSNYARRQKRFERELAILKKLRHPNIVRCYGGLTFADQRLFAMELVLGGNLHTLLLDGPLHWARASKIGYQLCLGLAHAHSNGIIHRDIKPANVMLTEDGRVKLADFGIARDADATALTAFGKTVGTLGYMAPEQIRGKPPVSDRTDLYALGCVLFETLTGEMPFKGKSASDMIYHHIDSQPPRVRELTKKCPGTLDQFVFELMAKDPKKRPASAVEAAERLLRIGTKRKRSTTANATPEPAVERGFAAVRLPAWGGPALIVAFVTVLAGLLLMLIF